jgi:hypothetical protein
MSKKNERTETVAWRVKPAHVRPINELVRKFLMSKNYNLYEKKSITEIRDNIAKRSKSV